MNERYEQDGSVYGYLFRLHAQAKAERGPMTRAWLGHQIVADLMSEMGVNKQPVRLMGMEVDIDWFHSAGVWFD